VVGDETAQHLEPGFLSISAIWSGGMSQAKSYWPLYSPFNGDGDGGPRGFRPKRQTRQQRAAGKCRSLCHQPAAGRNNHDASKPGGWLI
jgi:hypothetical protein